MKILVADDSNDVRVILSKLLQKWGHDVVTVDNGEAAWQVLRSQPISFALSDWMMPGLDGLELCRRIRAADFPHYVYVILLTARDDKSDLIAGMEAGADDFLTKPFNRDELRARIRAAERVLDLERTLEQRNQHLSQINAKLEDAYQRMRNDLEAAARVQASLLPRHATPHPGVRVDWLFCPAAVVAGDTFNYFALDERNLAFYHLDVAGHGVPSAMLSVTLSRVLSADLKAGSPLLKFSPEAPDRPTITPPHEVVLELNRRFLDDDCLLYFTMVYGVMDTHSGVVTLCQAGHPNPFRVSSHGEVETLGGGGFPVGMLPDVEYHSLELRLAPADRLVLYSDGIPDCSGPRDEPFGTERFARFLAELSPLPLHELVVNLQKRLPSWRGNDIYEDDISLLVIEMQ
jgi:sigma-B regulation protein RsbU (phosphoserine phosphatase)